MEAIINKKTIRKQFRSKVQQLREEERKHKSQCITDTVLARPRVQAAHVILIYVSTPFEVSTQVLINELLQLKKVLIVPRCEVKTHELKLYRIHDAAHDLRPGAYGISEPFKEENRYLEPVDTGIIPGVAFDTSCRRLGRGKGCFDRLLKRDTYRTMYKIGLSFAVQIAERIETEQHDVVMDEVVTEDIVYENV